MYRVMFVDDDYLPSGYDFALIQLAAGDMTVFIRETRVVPEVLEDAWLAARRANGEPGAMPRSA